MVLQSADLGFETDAVEDILLETEWCVLSGYTRPSLRSYYVTNRSTLDKEAARAAATEVVQHFQS